MPSTSRIPPSLKLTKAPKSYSPCFSCFMPRTSFPPFLPLSLHRSLSHHPSLPLPLPPSPSLSLSMYIYLSIPPCLAISLLYPPAHLQTHLHPFFFLPICLCLLLFFPNFTCLLVQSHRRRTASHGSPVRRLEGTRRRWHRHGCPIVHSGDH